MSSNRVYKVLKNTAIFLAIVLFQEHLFSYKAILFRYRTGPAIYLEKVAVRIKTVESKKSKKRYI